MLRTVFSKKAFIVPLSLLLAAMSCEAFSQGPAPVRQLIDENGVDLLTGQFNVSQEDIDIGPPEARLAFTRSAKAEDFGNPFAFYNNVEVGLLFVPADQTPDGVAYVSVGTATTSERFTQSGSTFTSQGGMGATLVFDAPTQRYIYTQRDGTVYRFPTPTSSEDRALVLSIEAPDGTKTEYSSKQWPNPPYTYSTNRVQSVVNNAGYQLKLEYDGPQSTRISKVAVLNRGAAYCDPAADTCAATATAPSVTFSWAQLPVSFLETVTSTDAAGRQTRWTLGAGAQAQFSFGGGPSAVKSAVASTDDTVVTFEEYPIYGSSWSLLASSVTRRGMTWNYELVQAFGQWPILKITNPRGHTREVQWNQVVSQVHSDKDEQGRMVTYQYDSFGRRTRVTFPQGNYIHYTYDGRGNVSEVRRVAKPGSGLTDIVSSAVYPASCTNAKTCNKPTSTTDEKGGVTDYTYDPTHGGVLTVTAPAPSSGAVRPQTRYAYTALHAWYKNSAGTIVQAPTPIHKLTEISACRTTASCSGTVDEVKTTFGYQVGSSSVASNLLLTSVTQSSGNGALVATTTMTYDDRGNRLTTDGPLAGAVDSITTRYDILRRVVGIVGPDPDGAGPLKRRAARYTYRLDNQITSVEHGTVEGLSDPQWAALSVLEQLNSGYDSNGQKTSEALVSGGSTLALTNLSYDPLQRIECVAVRMNPATFGSPPGSACTLGTAGAYGPDRITKRVYNAAGELPNVQTGVGTVAQRNEHITTFSTNSLPTTITDARGNKTTYEYDGHDRLYRLYFPSPTQLGVSSTTDYEQFTYDAAGNVTQKRLRDGQVIGFGFDALNRLQTKNLPGSEPDVTYGYDNIGHTTSVTTSAQTLTFGYDALGRLRTQQGPHGTFTSDYDLASRRTQLTWPDSFSVSYDYLVTGELSVVRETGATSGLGVLASFSYDNLGRRTQVTRGNGAVTGYGYGTASLVQQLTQNLAATSADLTEDLTYNPAGQIATRILTNNAYVWTENTNATRSYTPNGLNQYTSIGATSISSDARGNLTDFGTGAHGYSSENLLLSAPGTVTLTYDPVGRLYQTSSPIKTTRFSYDGDRLLAEYNSSNQLQRRYVHGVDGDEPLVWYEGSGTAVRRWLHADERGSIIAISDDSGAHFAVNRYDEHGLPSLTNTGRFQYTGQAWVPEANLYYYKARFYSAALGRFLQPDPIGYSAGMNLYAYVRGDPLNRVDPFGLDEVLLVGTRPSNVPIVCVGCVSPDTFMQLWGIPQEYLDRIRQSIDTALAPFAKDAETGCRETLIQWGNSLADVSGNAANVSGKLMFGGLALTFFGAITAQPEIVGPGLALTSTAGTFGAVVGGGTQIISGALQGLGGGGYSNATNAAYSLGAGYTVSKFLSAPSAIGFRSASQRAADQLRNDTATVTGGVFDSVTSVLDDLGPKQKSCPR